MEQENINAFHKQVYDIQSLHKSELSGNLEEYFTLDLNNKKQIVWVKNIQQYIKDKVEKAASSYLK